MLNRSSKTKIPSSPSRQSCRNDTRFPGVGFPFSCRRTAGRLSSSLLHGMTSQSCVVKDHGNLILPPNGDEMNPLAERPDGLTSSPAISTLVLCLSEAFIKRSMMDSGMEAPSTCLLIYRAIPTDLSKVMPAIDGHLEGADFLGEGLKTDRDQKWSS